jgi:hypothetical protein
MGIFSFLKKKKATITEVVRNDESSSPYAPAGTPVGSGVGGGTLVTDPTSPTGVKEVPMSSTPPRRGGGGGGGSLPQGTPVGSAVGGGTLVTDSTSSTGTREVPMSPNIRSGGLTSQQRTFVGQRDSQGNVVTKIEGKKVWKAPPRSISVNPRTGKREYFSGENFTPIAKKVGSKLYLVEEASPIPTSQVSQSFNFDEYVNTYSSQFKSTMPSQKTTIANILDFIVGESGKKYAGVGIPGTKGWASFSDIYNFVQKEKETIAKTITPLPSSSNLFSLTSLKSPSQKELQLYNRRVQANSFAIGIVSTFIPKTPGEVALAPFGFKAIKGGHSLFKTGVISSVATGLGIYGVTNTDLTSEERVASGLVAAGGIFGLGKVTTKLYNKPMNIKISPKVEVFRSYSESALIKKGESQNTIAKFKIVGVSPPRFAYQIKQGTYYKNKILGYGYSKKDLKGLSFEKLEDIYPQGKVIEYNKGSVALANVEPFILGKNGEILRSLRKTPSNVVGIQIIKATPSRATRIVGQLEGFTEPKEYNIRNSKDLLTDLNKKAFEHVQNLGKGKGIKIVQDFPREASFSLGEVKTTQWAKINSKGQLKLIPQGRRTTRGVLVGVKGQQLEKIDFTSQEFGLKEYEKYAERIGFVETTLPKVKHMNFKMGKEFGIPKTKKVLYLKGELGHYSPSKNEIVLRLFQTKKEGGKIQTFFHELGHANIERSGGFPAKIPLNVRKEWYKSGLYREKTGYDKREIPEEIFADYFSARALNNDVMYPNSIPKTTAFFENIIKRREFITPENLKEASLKIGGDFFIKGNVYKNIYRNKPIEVVKSISLIPKKSFLIEGTSKEYYFELPSESKQVNFIQPSGKKSSEQYLQQLYLEKFKPQVNKQIISTAVNMKPILKTSPIRQPTIATSSFAGTGLYERTEGIGGFALNQPARTTYSNIQPISYSQSNLFNFESGKNAPSVMNKGFVRILDRNITRGVTRETERSLNKFSPREIVKTQSREVLRTNNKQISRLITRTKTRTPPKTTIIIVPRNQITKNPTKTLFFFGGKGHLSQKPFGSFRVLQRRFGKFKVIGTTRTQESAFNLGMFKTRTTLSATFKVEGYGVKQPKNIFGYKTKYTKQGTLFIEQPKWRLSTPTEKQEIYSYRKLRNVI